MTITSRPEEAGKEGEAQVNYRLERVEGLVRDVVTQPGAHWGYWAVGLTVGLAVALLVVTVWLRPPWQGGNGS